MLKFWKKLNELYVRLLIVCFGIIMLIGAWQVYDNYYMFYHSLDSSIARYKPVPSSGSICAPEESPITEEMVAWLTIDNTNIDYPVMQGKSNTQFLNLDPFGNYALSGSIFLDSRSSPDFSDDFSLVYGHHMDYGKMFGALDAFLNASYFNKHTTGTLMIGRNAETVCHLEVFAAMRVNARETTVFDMEQEQIRQFIYDHAELLTEKRDARILGLSTCSDTDSMARIVVFCYIDG